MAKKTKDKKRLVTEKIDETYFEEQKEKHLKELERDFKNLSKVNLAEFKRGIVEQIKDIYGFFYELHDEVCTNIEFFAKQRDNLTGAIKVTLEQRDELLGKAFKERDEKIDSITEMVFMLACKAKGGPVSMEDREQISELLGCKWTEDNETALTSWAARKMFQSLS
jgi:hypothetical protein